MLLSVVRGINDIMLGLSLGQIILTQECSAQPLITSNPRSRLLDDTASVI